MDSPSLRTSNTSSESSQPSDKLTSGSATGNDNSADDLLAGKLDEMSWDEDEEANKKRGPYYWKMRRIGLTQLAIAVMCIVISIPLTVEVKKGSAGSGIWCSAFFILMAGINFTSGDSTKPFRVMVAFAATCVYFGILMLAVECVEIAALILDAEEEPPSKIVLILHFVLCMFAISEIGLTIVALVLCKRELKNAPKQIVGSETFKVDASRSVNIILAHVV